MTKRFRTESEQQEWLRALAARSWPPTPDRLGTMRYVDAAARQRAAAAVTDGWSISLSRPLIAGAGFQSRLTTSAGDGSPPTTAFFDEITLACHGRTQTHLDGLNHVSYDGRLYSGWPLPDVTPDPDPDSSSAPQSDLESAVSPTMPTPADWAVEGIFVRCFHADVSAARGSSWADADEPVSGADIDRALGATRDDWAAGDALLLDMGRDRYEQEGNPVRSQLEANVTQPGLGPSAAEWIADNKASVVCWDFLDAAHPELTHFSGHSLIWAVGQLFVDNCDFGPLRTALHGRGSSGVGGLMLAPLRAAATTGCSLNPIFLQ